MTEATSTSRVECVSSDRGFDRSCGATWIYPVDHSSLVNQLDIVETALLNNTLVCLQSDSAKTFIAAVVMYNFLRWYPGGRVLLVASTREELLEQRAELEKVMGLPREQTILLGGATRKHKRATAWMKARAVFATAQTLQRDLEGGQVPCESIKCVVLRHAQRALGGNYLCKIIEMSNRRNEHFRCLAFTTTDKIDHASEVMTNVHISRLEIPNHKMPHHSPRKDFVQKSRKANKRPFKRRGLEDRLVSSSLQRTSPRIVPEGILPKRCAQSIGASMPRSTDSQDLRRRGVGAHPYSIIHPHEVKILTSDAHAREFLELCAAKRAEGSCCNILELNMKWMPPPRSSTLTEDIFRNLKIPPLESLECIAGLKISESFVMKGNDEPFFSKQSQRRGASSRRVEGTASQPALNDTNVKEPEDRSEEGSSNLPLDNAREYRGPSRPDEVEKLCRHLLDGVSWSDENESMAEEGTIMSDDQHESTPVNTIASDRRTPFERPSKRRGDDFIPIPLKARRQLLSPSEMILHDSSFSSSQM